MNRQRLQFACLGSRLDSKIGQIQERRKLHIDVCEYLLRFRWSEDEESRLKLKMAQISRSREKKDLKFSIEKVHCRDEEKEEWGERLKEIEILNRRGKDR